MKYLYTIAFAEKYPEMFFFSVILKYTTLSYSCHEGIQASTSMDYIYEKLRHLQQLIKEQSKSLKIFYTFNRS